MSRFAYLLICLGSILGNSACSPVKGYPGPERPDQEISLIELEYNGNDIDLEEAVTEGVGFGSTGIKVLPGPHSFAFRVTVKEPPENCYSYPKMDHSGYANCLREEDKGKRRDCDCWDYLEIRRKCYRQGHDGSCQGEIDTRAGMRYQLQVNRRYREPEVRVVETNTLRKVGNAECERYGQRTIEEDTYEGTGRSEAYQNGIYYCD